MADAKDDGAKAPIIIKKINKGGGHHGGAWKVAYADFVTAMMAFFLLLWLLNVTTEEQKNAISNYFDPTHPKVSQVESGAGGILGGLSMTPQGAMTSQQQPLTPPPQPAQQTLTSRAGEKMHKDNVPPEKKKIEKAKETMRNEEKKRFDQAKEQIQKAIESDAELKDLMKNLKIDMTPEGLRIQVVDQEGKPMFASGSAEMFDATRKLLQKLAGVIGGLPNQISIRGHTDNTPYGKDANYTNWELSSDRANASRRVILDAGLKPARINNVVGKADTEPLLPDKPGDPQNRRLSIILLKEELTNPDFEKEAKKMADKMPNEQGGADEEGDGGNADPGIPVGTFRKTPGAVEFP